VILIPELPYEIWKERVHNEIEQLKHMGILDDSSLDITENDIYLDININAKGFQKIKSPEGAHLEPRNKHKAKVHINRQFPYAGGLEVKWITSIFHPNLDPLDHINVGGGTGYVCLNVLKKWSRLSDLSTSANALKMLVQNPNPDDPLNYPECLEAAAYFKEHPMEELLENDKQDEDDDIIVVDDD